MKKFNEIILLIKSNKFNESLNELDQLESSDRSVFEFYYLSGICFLNLNRNNEAIKNFTKAISLNDSNFSAYFYRGTANFKLNKLKEAKLDYKKAIYLKPNVAELYNNLASVHYKAGENEQAIENFNFSLNINRNLKSSILGLLNVLSQTKNVKEDRSDLILTHNELNKINFYYSENKCIDDLKIKELFHKINTIINKNLSNLELNTVQTYKENKFQPNCKRHHIVFNKKNIIPKFCFGCYKIQIEPDNVLDLIKLHIVFDKYKFEKNNIRKCMIELRPNIPGKYKGLIYCESIEEAEHLNKNLLEVIKKNLNKKISYKIKRGCSEFAIKFPKYKNLKKNKMKYDNNWQIVEDAFDKENSDLTFEKKTRATINGISLFDALVFRNWLAFAKIIGDQTYKKVSDEIFYSKLIEKKMKIKLQQI